MVRKFLFAAIASVFVSFASAQLINKDNLKLSNYVERMYRNTPFTGVKIVVDDDVKYLLSIVALNPVKYEEKGGDPTMDKVASVKALAQTSKFFNGSSISEETVIHTTENSDGTSDVDVIERIREKSVGFVKKQELLSVFYDEKGLKIYIYSQIVDSNE